MDNNFQTSFIPKKPLAEERAPVRQGTSLLSFIATIIFFTALASAVGVYFYKASLTKNIATMDTELTAARNSFEPDFITTLHRLDSRISAADELLGNHIVVTPIFAALQANTLQSIQFTKFTYTAPADPTAPIEIHMSGKARDYTSIALESDQLATNVNIHNSIFSNLQLDPQTNLVSFDLVFTVDADLVRFTKHLDNLGASTPASAASPAPTSPATSSSTPAISSGGQTSGATSSPQFFNGQQTGNTTPAPAATPTPSGTGQ